jgi:hypothetical protein
VVSVCAKFKAVGADPIETLHGIGYLAGDWLNGGIPAPSFPPCRW